MDAIQIHSRGIKCDAEGCDYVDPSVTVDQYESFIDKPCPKCGANLLTREDFDLSQMLRATAQWINSLVGPVEGKGPTAVFQIRADGSGIPEFVEVDHVGEERK